MSSFPIARQASPSFLARLLDEPNLDGQLAELDGAEWKSLVADVGLEDCGELIALASAQQLLELLDEDLWLTNADGGETVDAERFATFLEVLRESGAESMAQKVAELSFDFVCLALGSLISVWPTRFLERYAELDEDGMIQKKLEGQHLEEFEDYIVLSKSGTGFDVTVDLLSTWHQSSFELFDRVLSRLADANVSDISDGDELVEALDGMDVLREEAEAEREERRAALGYVSASDARAFSRLPPLDRPAAKDAISAAYFRRLRPDVRRRSRSTHHTSGLERLLERGKANRGLLPEPKTLLARAMERLQEQAPDLHAQYVEELAFLVNVSVANQTEEADERNPALALRNVVKRVECNARREESAEQLTVEELVLALRAWSPIGLFRRHPPKGRQPST